MASTSSPQPFDAEFIRRRGNLGCMAPYLVFRPRRVLVSLTASALLVPAVALAAKAVIEALTSLTYTIHWLETVPLLVGLFAFVLNGAWNRRDPPDAAR